MPNLKIGCHGGKCCGIHIIYNFPAHRWVKTKQGSLRPRKTGYCNDRMGLDVSTRVNVYHEAAPKETLEERLDRYLAFLRRRNPKSLVEIVLAQSSRSSYYEQEALFGELVRSRGFKLVQTFMNSNSCNTCYVYHLVLD